MIFVKNFSLPDLQAKILQRRFHQFATVLVIKGVKYVVYGEIYPAGKNFTFLPEGTNLTSEKELGQALLTKDIMERGYEVEQNIAMSFGKKDNWCHQ